MARTSKKINRRARLLRIEDIEGWVLIGKDDDLPSWNIAWMEPFSTKKSALAFAADNRWPKPYEAVRGRITIDPAR